MVADIGIPRRDCENPQCGVNFQPVRKGQAFHSNACRLALYTQARAVGLEIFKVWGRFPTDKEIRGMMDISKEDMEGIKKLLDQIHEADLELIVLKSKVKIQNTKRDSAIADLDRVRDDIDYGNGPLFEKQEEDQEQPEEGAETPGEEPVAAGAPAADRHEVE